MKPGETCTRISSELRVEGLHSRTTPAPLDSLRRTTWQPLTPKPCRRTTTRLRR